MADDKKGRNKQADDEERRQRERELQEARERNDEPEPIDPALDDELENREYPTTADELVGAHGDREVDTRDGSKPLEDVFAPIEDESYDSADAVRARIRELTDH
ncbi:hypothetical protein C477_09409 [Haloterrigena salina JCM 13891]|uniref:DUF2795 domain-containing protein n=1 Tax=Haloterrigena salina JCM 13891 TaxID=1227488 RepID=M0C6Y0_9EURY|nr:hypothetical protein [Haloterrigena salina]ELZ18975.1 hypothetical protein C477_09409 [Haloterrigena salina JCM 13891]